MNQPLSKLRDSMAQQNGKMPQDSGGSGNQNQANGPDRGVSKGGKTKKKKNIVLPVLLVLMGVAVFLFAAWSAVNSPVLASILSISSSPQQVQKAPVQSFAQVDIAKPTYTPVGQQFVVQVIQPTVTFTAIPEVATEPNVAAPLESPSISAVVLPTDTPFIEVPTATSAPQQASESGGISAQIIPDTPTAEFVAQPTTAAAVAIPAAASGNGGEHWIDVNLSEQRLYAYEGDTLVNSFIVSTGTWQTPTVTGSYKIWVKLRSAAMSGPGYYLPDVPYIMYFYKGYGLHGTYWHNNFGTPMSHGCVNLSIPDAEWVYNFTNVGTVVNVHY
jgi:lipoprotein-anchoring transpeptidase ErfK/SrfK